MPTRALREGTAEYGCFCKLGVRFLVVLMFSALLIWRSILGPLILGNTNIVLMHFPDNLSFTSGLQVGFALADAVNTQSIGRVQKMDPP